MKYVCNVCGYVYDEAVGDPDNGIAAGTKWEDLPTILSARFAESARTISRRKSKTRTSKNKRPSSVGGRLFFRLLSRKFIFATTAHDITRQILSGIQKNSAPPLSP